MTPDPGRVEGLPIGLHPWIDLAEQQYRLIWESNPDEDGVEGALLSGVDNITVDDATGDLFVAEDGGDMDVCIITPEGAVARFARVAETPNGSEITGPCMSPDRTRLYFSSQRGTSPKGLNEIIPGCDKDAKIAQVESQVTYDDGTVGGLYAENLTAFPLEIAEAAFDYAIEGASCGTFTDDDGNVHVLTPVDDPGLGADAHRRKRGRRLASRRGCRVET